ncbi:MAG: ankyrin repeat domain-containing protein [Candidatus Wallbacteria bacterium]|nr:ankyrin repeat domain-containing protein [Candidatus Wallbacteria bacterium]
MKGAILDPITLALIVTYFVIPVSVPLLLLLLTSPIWWPWTEKKALRFIKLFAMPWIPIFFINFLGMFLIIYIAHTRLYFAQPRGGHWGFAPDRTEWKPPYSEDHPFNSREYEKKKKEAEEKNRPLKKIFFAQTTWEVQALLDQGVDVNAEDENGITPLMFAVHRRDLTITKYLIGKGADVEHLDGVDHYPIFLELFYGNSNIVINYHVKEIKSMPSMELLELLVRSGADIDRFFKTECQHCSINCDVLKMCKLMHAKDSDKINLIGDGHENRSIQKWTIYTFFIVCPILVFLNFARAVWLDVKGDLYKKQLYFSFFMLIILAFISPFFDYLDYAVLINGFRNFRFELTTFLAFLLPNLLMMFILWANCRKITALRMRNILPDFHDIAVKIALLILYGFSAIAFQSYMVLQIILRINSFGDWAFRNWK